MTQLRVPAGSGLRGGQFAPIGRVESAEALTAAEDRGTVADQLVYLVGFTSQGPEAAHRLLPGLPAYRVSQLWESIQIAEQLALGYEDDPSEFALGQDEHPAPEPPVGGPDIHELINDEDYRIVEEPDRPGESWNVGCDWDSIGLEMRDRWRAHAISLAEAAVAEHDAAETQLRRAS